MKLHEELQEINQRNKQQYLIDASLKTKKKSTKKRKSTKAVRKVKKKPDHSKREPLGALLALEGLDIYSLWPTAKMCRALGERFLDGGWQDRWPQKMVTEQQFHSFMKAYRSWKKRSKSYRARDRL